MPSAGFAIAKEAPALFPLEDFRKSRLTGSANHACTDCTFALTRDGYDVRLFCDGAVGDGVAWGPPIRAVPHCGDELINNAKDVFCGTHFPEHYLCGVTSGPGLTDSCRRKVTSRCGDKTYDEHGPAEDEWRQNGRPDSDDFAYDLREQRRRGR